MIWFIVALHSSEKFQTPWKLDVKNRNYNMNINVHVWMCVHAHPWVCVSHLCVWVCAFAACIWKSEDNLGCFFLQVPFAFDLRQGLSLEMDFVHRSGRQAPALPEILLSLPTLSEPHFILYGSFGFELRSSHVQDQHFTNWAISPTHLFAVFCSKICTLIDVKLSAFLITSLQGKYLRAQLQNC